MKLRISLFGAACLALFPSVARAATMTVTLTAADSGWYDDTGAHDPGNENYLVGFCGSNACSSATLARDFFVFDVAGVTRQVLGATLRLRNPSGGYNSVDASEEYTLYEVATDTATLTSGGAGMTATYDDLGDGPVYATRTVSAADSDTIVEIPLDAAGIDAINASVSGDGLFAMGGALTTVVAVDPANEFMFGGTDENSLRELVLEVQAVDDYNCYKAKDLKNPKFATISGLQLDDGLLSDSNAEVKKPFLLCAPVDVNGRGIVDPGTSLCCYKIKAQKLDTKAQATVTDPFGSLDVEVFKPQVLCRPCLVEWVP